jgi:hypothetical protein
MRALSLAARRAMFAPSTDQVFLALLTISGTGIPTPLRFVNNSEDVVSNGNTHLAYPFQISLPDEREDSPAQVTLIIDNIDQSIVAGIRLLTKPPKITLEVILASDPDTVEAGPFEFSLNGVEYNAITVTGTLAFEEVLNEPYPCDSFDPTRFPGLYAGHAGNVTAAAA